MEVVSLADRPGLAPAAAKLVAGPEFIFHDPVAAEFWHRLIEDFSDYQTALVDDGRVVARGVSIPFHWDRPDDELPGDGWDFALRQGVVALIDKGDYSETSWAFRDSCPVPLAAETPGLLADVSNKRTERQRHQLPRSPIRIGET